MDEQQQPDNISDKQCSTVVSGWSVAVGRALDALGYQGDDLLRSAGVDINARQDSEIRFSSEHTRKLWALALEETGQEDIGLQVARYVCPTTFHALGFSLWASCSLKEALERMVRFDTLLNDGCTLSLSDTDNATFMFRMSVKLTDSVALVTAEGVDYFLGAVIKMFRDMAGNEFNPVTVNLTRPEPNNPELWQSFFNCPVQFNQPENSLILPAEQLTRTLPTGNQMLAAQNDKLVEEYLQRFQIADLTNRVRSALIQLMPLGLTTLEDVATELDIPPRTLQYKLNQTGTTIQKLRDQIREELARNYLQHSRQSITQIAYSLGFSDPAHLNRAFKRWTGETPSSYRKRLGVGG